MVGDRTADIQLARNAGVRALLVRTGHAGEDGQYPARPDYEFFDLAEATDFMLDAFEPAVARAADWLADCRAGDLVVLGGLGRSGKSIWASIFRETLGRRGQRAVCVPLDAWLRSEADRTPGHVLGRFDTAGIDAFAARLSERHTTIEVALAGYDRRTRTRLAAQEALRIEPNDVVIVEGVPALAIDGLVSRARCHFYVDCDERERRRRFDREYSWRGLDPASIERLYDQREADEHPFIRRTAAVADIVIREPRP